MKTAKTPYQKEQEKLQSAINQTVNRIRSAFQFNKIVTYRDYLLHLGHDDNSIKLLHLQPAELNKVLTFPDLKSLLEDYSISMRVDLWLMFNPPDTSDLKPASNVVVEAIDQLKLAAEIEEQKHAPKSDDEEGQDLEHDYGFVTRPDAKVFHYNFQKKAVMESWQKIYVEQKPCTLLVSGTGTGKTFIIGELLRRLWDAGFYKASCSPWPVVWVTKASVVTQTKRVLEDWFGFNTITQVIVVGIDQLRSKFGQMYINETITVQQGVEYVTYNWRPLIHPIHIIWDESQSLKNTNSIQSKIAQAYNDITIPVYQTHVSATPFTRVIEAKCFCVGTKIPNDKRFASGGHLTNRNWNDFAKWIAAPAEPQEHSPAAIDRLMTYMDAYVVRCKGIRWQFKARNQVKIVDFDNDEDRKFYWTAWERYMKEKAKIEAMAKVVHGGRASMLDGSFDADLNGSGVNRFMILAQFTKFRQASELCHAKHIVAGMVDAVSKGQAGVAALNFKHTIVRCIKILIEEYGVNRNQISVIFGGGLAKNKKKEMQDKLKASPEAIEALRQAGISLADLELGDDDIAEIDKAVQDEKIPASYRLGPQNLKQRQEEIDRFQRGDSLFCFFSFKAGGVGLSLHHTDEYTKAKIRKKKNGYAIIEDIHKIPTRQRVCFLTPTYSAMELVQGLGRCPRLTSLSDTSQTVMFFAGTIEERVAAIVSQKLRCLTHVVRQRESWEDVILGAKTQHDAESMAIVKLQEAEAQANKFAVELVDDDDIVLDINEEEGEEE
jgi:hypothetical protein